MATNFFNTPWSDRSPIERILLLGVGIGGSIFLLVKGKKIIQQIKFKQQQMQITSDITATGDKLSYLQSQYNSFADTLYTAMNGAGTDETAVAGIMYKMKNDADVLKLIQTFGQREGATLAEWIADDFDQEDKTFYINSILAKKGISFRF
jgi:hypothetical protein